MALASTVYTAPGHGYDWSCVPAGWSRDALENLHRLAVAARPEFPSSEDVDAGVVSDGLSVAAFSVRQVPGWDALGRPAEYAAFVLLRCADAAAIDFVELLKNDFFHVPARAPATSIVYAGPASARPAMDVPGRLLCTGRLDDFDLASAGALLAQYGAKSPAWTFRVRADAPGRARVETAPWRRPDAGMKGGAS